jgi:hypothetical protein
MTGGVQICNVQTGKVQTTLRGHEARVWSIAFSRDGSVLATTSKDHTIRLWRASDGQQLAVLQEHTDEVNCVAFSADGHYLASASDDATAIIWEFSGHTAQALARLRGHSNWVRSLSWGAEDKVTKPIQYEARQIAIVPIRPYLSGAYWASTAGMLPYAQTCQASKYGARLAERAHLAGLGMIVEKHPWLFTSANHSRDRPKPSPQSLHYSGRCNTSHR